MADPHRKDRSAESEPAETPPEAGWEKTHRAVLSLAESLQKVVKRQDRYDRGVSLNSFVAYVLFTVLLGLGFFALYKARAGALVDARDEALDRVEAVEKELAELRQERDARRRAEKEAEAFWQLLEDEKRAEAIARYPEIADAPLSAVEQQVFHKAVGRARGEIVEAGFGEGKESFEAGQWRRAVSAFKRALAYEEDGPRAAEMKYYLGVALHNEGEHAEAIKNLESAVSAGIERGVGADARYYLGASFEAQRDLDRARIEFEKFVAAHPKHRLYWAARRHLFEINKSMRD